MKWSSLQTAETVARRFCVTIDGRRPTVSDQQIFSSPFRVRPIAPINKASGPREAR